MSDTLSATILVVEDDPEQLRLYVRALRGYRLVCVATARAGLQAVRRQIPDLIILDQVLEGGERGTDFLTEFKRLAAHVPVIMISGTMGVRDQLRALQGPLAAHYVIEKPVDIDELEKTVEIALTECGMKEAILALQSIERAEKTVADEPDRRFTERLARQHALLRHLRGRPDKPNISHLARDYAVSRKTIIRDLHDLIRRGQLPDAIYPELEAEQSLANE